jgi:hypothetical protein
MSFVCWAFFPVEWRQSVRRVAQVLEQAQRGIGSCCGRERSLMPAMIISGPQAVFCIVEVCASDRLRALVANRVL